MKLTLALAAFLVSFSSFADWKSIKTDLSKDCVLISAATEEAPIDFYEAECKAFGGFQFFIEGSDLRYSPRLNFRGEEVSLVRPMSFHDLASNEVEWIYKGQMDNEGAGKISWKGLIYSISAATEDGEGDEVRFYSVKLNGVKSCVVGKTKTAEEARILIESENARCLDE